MPTRRKLILGSAALLATACGESKPPAANAPAPAAGPIDMTLPTSSAYALAIIAQSRRLWSGMEANLVMANDDATLARGFNSDLIGIGGMTLDRFLFWRSGGSKLQLAAWASHEDDLGHSGVYVVREGLEKQGEVVDRFVSGLKAADAWMRANADDAAKLVAAQLGAQPVELAALVAGADANRALLAAASDGENQSLKVMRPLDEAMRNDGSAGHQAFLPDIIAEGAAAAWAR